MTKKVFVSSAQKSAAQAMVERSAVTGRAVSKSVHKIANAKIEPVAAESIDAAARSGKPSRRIAK